jgi:hypothetical protein
MSRAYDGLSVSWRVMIAPVHPWSRIPGQPIALAEVVSGEVIEDVMIDDPDLPKANRALLVLRQARLSRNEAAAIMIGDLVYETASTGLRTPEIEGAHQAAWVATAELARALNKEKFAPPTLWKAALQATERWRELLT